MTQAENVQEQWEMDRAQVIETMAAIAEIVTEMVDDILDAIVEFYVAAIEIIIPLGDRPIGQ